MIADDREKFQAFMAKLVEPKLELLDKEPAVEDFFPTAVYYTEVQLEAKFRDMVQDGLFKGPKDRDLFEMAILLWCFHTVNKPRQMALNEIYRDKYGLEFENTLNLGTRRRTTILRSVVRHPYPIVDAFPVVYFEFHQLTDDRYQLVHRQPWSEQHG